MNLIELAVELNQRGPLAEIIAEIQRDPDVQSKMPNAAEKFCGTSAKITALKSCLIVARYIYLIGCRDLGMNVQNLEDFKDFYIKGINDQAIVQGGDTNTFSWVANAGWLITPYIQNNE